jgi:DNA mismatch repair protein MutL
LRHATSKITSIDDLQQTKSLGFRGEALSSIAAVAKIEVITKTKEALTGVRFLCEVASDQDGEQSKDFFDAKIEEVGAPTGTTFLVRDLFYHTPVRRKFLKQKATEGGYIFEWMEHLALGRPDVSFKFVLEGKVRFHTSGNRDLKEVIYRIYGKETATQLTPIDSTQNGVKVTGYLGKPQLMRSNRSHELFFLNGRFIKSTHIAAAIEEGYKPYLMQHKFPFCVLLIEIDPGSVDVNVHPAKLEVRFEKPTEVTSTLLAMIKETLSRREMIPDVTPETNREWKNRIKQEQSTTISYSIPEPFETKRAQQYMVREEETKEEILKHTADTQTIHAGTSTLSLKTPSDFRKDTNASLTNSNEFRKETNASLANSNDLQKEGHASSATSNNLRNTQNTAFIASNDLSNAQNTSFITSNDLSNALNTSFIASNNLSNALNTLFITSNEQGNTQNTAFITTNNLINTQNSLLTTITPTNIPTAFIEVPKDLFEAKVISRESRSRFQLIGQLFNTYWLMEYENSLYIIDQHAAHEKVKYERLMKAFKEQTIDTQNLLPPIIVTLTGQEEVAFLENRAVFEAFGFTADSFGGNEYALRTVPTQLYGASEKSLFLEVLDSLHTPLGDTLTTMEEKIASLSCKAAVKGNTSLGFAQANALIDELLTLENPYRCPHGRPTIISMSHEELDRKFKRLL